MFYISAYLFDTAINCASNSNLVKGLLNAVEQRFKKYSNLMK